MRREEGWIEVGCAYLYLTDCFWVYVHMSTQYGQHINVCSVGIYLEGSEQHG